MNPAALWNRILIVDDNPAIHADFRKVLAPPTPTRAEIDDLESALFGQPEAPSPAQPFVPFELESAHQGQEGAERVRQSLQKQRPFALAFVDVRMPPGWDGIETTQQLWRLDPSLPVVLCTAYSDYSWDETIGRLGVSERLLILKKPFDSIEVRQIAYSLREKRALMQRLAITLGDMERMVAERTGALQQANQELQRQMRERQQIEVELRHAQKLEAVGQLAAGIAHEINTPVQFIGDSVQFLRDGWSDLWGVLEQHELLLVRARAAGLDPALVAAVEQAQDTADLSYLKEQAPRAFERTLEGIERVSSIVRAMKEFAHPTQREMAPADVNRMLRTTLTVARNEYRYVADVETALGEIPQVVCSPGDLNQVFLNLVVNAAHAISDVVKDTGQRGTIHVHTHHEDDAVVVAVRDTGCGIPEEIQPRIFDPFFTTKEVGRGTGQGLAITRSIVVERHGGAVTFQSEVGRGTTFFVRLPVGGPAAAGGAR